MTGGGQGQADARQASQLQSQLFKQYAAVGAPALGSALGYTRGALAQNGLPAYVESAYQQAGAGALDQNVSDLAGLRKTLGANKTGAGGAMIQGLTSAIGSAGDAYNREMAGIRTGRAVAGIEQRNKLLGILAGGAATGTSLSAGFGSLGNRAISLEPQNQTAGILAGGLSIGTGLYAALNQPSSGSGLWGFNPNASGGYNPYLGAYQGGGGTLNLTTGGSGGTYQGGG